MKFALVGNPNSGKTTLFNSLTGSRAQVGNWPGVTVEKKEGVFTYNDTKVNLVDLPGIYSLSPYSDEEIVARNFLLEENPDLIINIVDVTNFERNLYLTTQLMETGIPIVLAINMMDVLNAQNGSVDVENLEKRIGLPCVPISASKSNGIQELARICVEKTNNKKSYKAYSVLEKARCSPYIEKLQNILEPQYKDFSLFYSIKALEEDSDLLKKVSPSLKNEILTSVDNFKKVEGIDSFDIVIADERYKFIEVLLLGIVTKGIDEKTESMSDKIDKVVTNKYFGIPLFFLTMLAIFMITFSSVGSFLQGIMDYLINTLLVGAVTNGLTNLGASDWAIGLVAGGIIPGVGMVLTFLPQIIILFLFLTILEDVGYMARAAFIMDNLLRRIGLSGKAFVPMLMGFGCSVPAIMATRTLENKRDRRMAIILTPFMSCSARFPVYVIFAQALFPKDKYLVIFSLYILGILIAILSGLILKNTVLKSGNSTFIMELPPYRMPIAKNVMLSLWDKAEGFVKRAGTVLLAASIVIWALQSFNMQLQMVDNNTDSIFGTIGTFIAPIFRPLGFGTWQASVSLLTGFVAKEAVVSSLSILYDTGDSKQGLIDSVSQNFTQLSAYAYMTFVLLYMPCIVAFATIKKEMNSWKWTGFAVVFQTTMAYVVALLIFQIGSRL